MQRMYDNISIISSAFLPVGVSVVVDVVVCEVDKDAP